MKPKIFPQAKHATTKFILMKDLVTKQKFFTKTNFDSRKYAQKLSHKKNVFFLNYSN